MNVELELHFNVEEEQQQDGDWLPGAVVSAAIVVFLLYVFGLLWWALAAVVAAVSVRAAQIHHRQAAGARDAVLCRLDDQHRQVMSGDARGLYGAGYEAWRDYRQLSG